MIKLIITLNYMALLLGFFGVNWASIDKKIAGQFPAVPFVSAEQLVVEQRADSIVLVDVREADEFTVSHLHGAVNIESAASIAANYPDKDATIIVYCSVGYRSAGVANELLDMGYSNVRNLHHSIFDWAERGLPMVNSNGATEKVHPFNRIWGRLVNKDLHAYDSPANLTNSH